MFRLIMALVVIALCWAPVIPSPAAVTSKTFDLDSPAPSSPVQILNGLSARATFVLDDAFPTLLTIELLNTSTGLPDGFSNSDQILTAISFDFGHPGYNGDPQIIGGSVTLGPDGGSWNMDTPVGPGANLSGEWGYGNMDGTGLLTNLVSATTAQATAFGGPNLDGPVDIDGPQGGIVTAPPLLPMGGLGAVSGKVIISLELDAPLTDLDFLDENGVMCEFGSDAAYLVPEPVTLMLLAIGGMGLLRRRRC